MYSKDRNDKISKLWKGKSLVERYGEEQAKKFIEIFKQRKGKHLPEETKRKISIKLKSLTMNHTGLFKKGNHQIFGFKKGHIPKNKGVKSGKIIKCYNCDKEKYFQPNSIKKNKRFFCSSKCQREFTRGKNHPMYNKKHPREIKKIIGIKSKETWGNKEFIEEYFNKKYPIGKRMELLNLIRSGLTLKDIHKESGLAIETIKKILIKSGLNNNELKNNQKRKLSKQRKKDWGDEKYRENNLNKMNKTYNRWRSNPTTHPRWKGGIAFEPYDIKFDNQFKREIRKRDNQICMLCLIHREKIRRALNVHHINYDKKLTIKENCLSLCDSCHSKVNENREHWTKFFQSLLTEKYGYKYSDKDIVININDNINSS
jgi:hypothetical protein